MLSFTSWNAFSTCCCWRRLCWKALSASRNLGNNPPSPASPMWCFSHLIAPIVMPSSCRFACKLLAFSFLGDIFFWASFPFLLFLHFGLYFGLPILFGAYSTHYLIPILGSPYHFSLLVPFGAYLTHYLIPIPSPGSLYYCMPLSHVCKYIRASLIYSYITCSILTFNHVLCIGIVDPICICDIIWHFYYPVGCCIICPFLCAPLGCTSTINPHCVCSPTSFLLSKHNANTLSPALC